MQMDQLSTMSEAQRAEWAAELRRRRDDAHARLDTKVAAMDPDRERLPPGLTLAEYAELVDP